jgi:hypothetical protein
VLSGEIALERLQNAVKLRISKDGQKFHNQYELAAYIYKTACCSISESSEEPLMGRVDLLLHFLRMINLDTPEKLRNYISSFEMGRNNRPFSEEIIDRILYEFPEYYTIYSEAQNELDKRNLYDGYHHRKLFPREGGVIEFFISRWIDFETTFREAYKKIAPYYDPEEFIYPSYENLRIMDIFSEDSIMDLESIKNMRNELVHGIHIPSNDTLIKAGSRLENFCKQIEDKIGLSKTQMIQSGKSSEEDSKTELSEQQDNQKQKQQVFEKTIVEIPKQNLKKKLAK